MAQVAETDTDRRIGTLVGGRWRIERRLGSGGMATVYAATDDSGQRAAIKVLHEEMARKADVRQRFLNEAYVANRIGHPGAVQIMEHGEGADTYLVMELLDGQPLSDRLQAAHQMTVRELLGYADQILDVLAAAHASGVVHRDIKPDNVFVTNDGRVKILDFGIARVLDDVPQAFKTRTGMALGTIPYMAPEQALGKRAQLDGRVDVFALGALLFRVLAGRRIHEAPSEAELLVAMATQPAPKLDSVAPNVPASVCKVIDTALSYAREARYPDAKTMQTDVRAVLAGGAPPYVTGTVVAHRDAPTRVGAAAPAPSVRFDAPTRVDAPAPMSGGFDAPTRVELPPVSQAPASIGQPPVSQAPYSLQQPPVSQAPASFVAAPSAIEAPPVSQIPMSQSPMSFAGPASATLPAVMAPPPAKKSRGPLLFLILAGVAVLALGGTALAMATYLYEESSPGTAQSGAPAQPDNSPAAEGQKTPASGEEQAKAAAGSGTTGSKSAAGGSTTTANQEPGAPGNDPPAAGAVADNPGTPANEPSKTSSATSPTAATSPTPAPAAPAPTSTATGGSSRPTATTPPAPAPTPAATAAPAPTSTAAGRTSGKGQGKGHKKSK